MPIEIDSLQIEIEGTSSDAASKVDALAASLQNLKAAAKGGAGLTAVINQLNKLRSALSGVTGDAGAIGSVSKAINDMKTNMTNMSGAAAGMEKVSRAVKAAKVDYSSLSSEVRSVANLFGQLSPGVQSSVQAFSRASAAMKGLSGSKASASVNEVRAALYSASTAAKNVSSGFGSSTANIKNLGMAFAALPPQVQKAITANTRLTASNQRTAKSFGVLGTGISSAQARFGIYLLAFRQLGSVIGRWVAESNDYVENLNLFTVAMGDFAAEAKAYADEVQSLVGIDSSEWMRNQGTFMQMASGFGVASESAALMSKNLTQLGYDISSFYNIDIEDAMQKLQSGMAGELEPLRRLGYALDVATLQQVAYDNGIRQNINSMTQAQKSQLRYLAIMEQSGNAMGDLARTVQTPANAVRILQQQFTQLARAAGNLLIPALQKIIPVVQAVVEILTDAIQALANLFGFELPSIDYSGLGGVATGAEDAQDAVEGATDAVKDLKNATLGIDELNIISPQDASGAAGSGGVDPSDWQLALPEYDFLDGLVQDTEELKEQLKEILFDYVLPIGAGLAAWKLASNLVPELGRLQGLLGSLMVAVGITLLIDSIEDIIINGKLTWKNILKGAAGGAIAGAGLGLMLAKKWGLSWAQGMLVGAVVGVGLSLVVMAVTSELKSGLNAGNAILGAIGGATAGAGIGAGVALKAGTSLVSGAALGAVIGVGVTLTVMGVISQLKEGVNLANGLMTTIGAGIAGAGIGFTVGGPVGALVGLGLGLVVGLVITTQIARIQKDEASYQAAVQEIQQQAIMTVTEATDLFSRWYDTWLPSNQVILELVATKEGLAQDVADAHKALQSTLETITQDGKLAQDELEALTQAVNTYFSTIKADMSANNSIIHEALVGALKTASAEGVGYYQDLIDKHNEWIAAEQGALGVMQQQVNEAYAAMLQATPGTTEYTTAVDEYTAALNKLSEVSSAENTAKLQMYASEIEQLKEAISSGKLDVTQVEEAKASLDEISQKLKTTLQDIETTKDSVMLAIQTEINRATMIGDSEHLSYLGDIKSTLEADFEAQREGVISAANGIGATIATAIGNQMFNLMQTTDTGTIQRLVDEQYTPLLEYWTDAAKGVVTNSEELKSFPQLTLDTMMEGWANLKPDLDEDGQAVIETWNQKLIDSAKSSLDDVLNKTDLGPQAQKFMDGLAVSFGSANIDQVPIQNGVNEFVSATEDAAGIHSPAEIMFPVGENLMAGIEEGFQNRSALVGTSIQSAMDTFASIAIPLADKSSADLANALMQGIGENLSWEKTFRFSELEQSVDTATAEYGAGIELMRQQTAEFSEYLKIEVIDVSLAYFLAAVKSALDYYESSLKSAQAANQSFTRAVTSAYRSMSSSSVSAISSIISALNSIPRSITTVHTIITQRMEETVSSGGTGKGVKAYATGGYPDIGQMFLARESGPELVGTIGGRTAVANNDQIERGIEEAAYRGFLRAMAEAEQQPIVVDNKLYLDGKQLRTATQKADREAGVSIMSGGVMTR